MGKRILIKSAKQLKCVIILLVLKMRVKIKIGVVCLARKTFDYEASSEIFKKYRNPTRISLI